MTDDHPCYVQHCPFKIHTSGLRLWLARVHLGVRLMPRAEPSVLWMGACRMGWEWNRICCWMDPFKYRAVPAPCPWMMGFILKAVDAFAGIISALVRLSAGPLHSATTPEGHRQTAGPALWPLVGRAPSTPIRKYCLQRQATIVGPHRLQRPPNP